MFNINQLIWLIILVAGGIAIFYFLYVNKNKIRIIDKALILSKLLVKSNEENYYKAYLYQYGKRTHKIFSLSYLSYSKNKVYCMNLRRIKWKIFYNPFNLPMGLIISGNKFQFNKQHVHLNRELTLQKFYDIICNPSDSMAIAYIKDFSFKLNTNLVDSSYYAQAMKNTIVDLENITSGQHETETKEINKKAIKDAIG